MVQLGCFFHQNISFTLKIGGRIESKIKVKMYAQEDTAVILIISLINENTLASWEQILIHQMLPTLKEYWRAETTSVHYSYNSSIFFL